MVARRCFVILACTFALSSGLLAGCGDDDTPACPPANVGTIHGIVQAGGQPIRTRVQAVANPRDPQDPGSIAYVQTTSDSSGAYSMELPDGQYLLMMDASRCARFYAHGRLVEEGDAETLKVGQGESIVASVSLGAARLEVTTPAELEGFRYGAVLVSAHSPECRISGSGQITNGHASIAFPRVDPGTYRMKLSFIGAGEVWLPGAVEESSADSIMVTEGAEAVYQSSLPQPGRLMGTVTGSWQELGQYPPRLRLTDLAGRQSIATTQANSVDGSYDFFLYASGSALLRIEIDNVGRWYGGTTVDDATPIELVPGGTVELNIRESGIAGWINREVPSGSPPIYLTDADGNPRGFTSPDGPRGFFRISNLAAGTYYMQIPAGPTWIDQYYDKAESLAHATPIQVTEEGQVVWLDVDLESGGSIEGQLFRDDGVPAYGVPIDLVGRAGTNLIRRERSSGQEAGFAFSALPDGDYRIVAHPNEINVPVWYPGVTDSAQAVVISIRDHADVTEIFFDLP